MIYRTCQGCLFEHEVCAAKEAVRKKLAGIGVTSLKWRCKVRRHRFEIGDPVWALTVESKSEYDDYGELYRDHFPAHVIRHCGSKALVFIQPGAKGRSGDDGEFQSETGFCKLPISRLSKREGQRENVCKGCERPESMGHAKGYSCQDGADGTA